MMNSQQAMAALNAQGIPCDLRTVQRWAAAGLFPGARKTAEGPRGDWEIPEEPIEHFVPPSARVSPANRDGHEVALMSALDEAYRPSWATAYFTALRDDQDSPWQQAGVSRETVEQEAYQNKSFAVHREYLWCRRYRLKHSAGSPVIRMDPDPIWTPAQLAAAMRGDRSLDIYHRLKPKDRPRYMRARACGYLFSNQCSQALRNVWWRHCETYNLPYIVQRRNGRWYTELEMDLTRLFEADGRPRRLNGSSLDAVNALTMGERQRRKKSLPDPQPRTNRRYCSDLYLPYTTADLAGELLAIYRSQFPDDPPPNPELDARWEGPKMWDQALDVRNYRDIGDTTQSADLDDE